MMSTVPDPTKMLREHIKLLNDNHSPLGKQFRHAVDDICDHLVEKRIIRPEQKNTIVEKKQRGGDEIVYLIQTRGPQAFEALYEASKAAQLYIACDILNPLEAPHEPEEEVTPDNVESDFVKIAPEEEPWPSDEYVKGLEVKKVENKDKYECHKSAENDNIYKMTNSVRGYPLLVYDNKSLSSDDRTQFQSLFQSLGFKSMVAEQVKDKTDLDELLQTEPSFTTECDCFLLLVVATEGGYLNREGLRLIKESMNEREVLLNKPKLIFHLTLKPGNAPNPQNGKKSSGIGIQTRGSLQQQEEFKEEDIRTGDSVDCFPFREASTPKDSDFCFIIATEYGCEEFQVPGKNVTGIRFIHLIVDIFSRHAKDLPLIDLLRLVNLRTGQLVAHCTDSRRKQLYFFPGCSEQQIPN